MNYRKIMFFADKKKKIVNGISQARKNLLDMTLTGG